MTDSARTMLYLRVSTEDQAVEGTSLASQEDRARKHASEHELEIVRAFADVHSGSVWRERPALSELREAVRAGGVDVVLCYALDRLSRHQAHVAILMDEFERHGARLELVTETFEDSAVGRFILAAKAFAAEIEQEQRVERTIRGKRQRVLSGKIHRSGIEKFGYRRDNEAGVRRLHAAEAAVVRMIFEMCAYEGKGLRGIEHDLNDRGIPAPSAGKVRYEDGHTPQWSKSQLFRMLHDPAYKGTEFVWRWEGTQWSTRDESEWIAMPDHVTPAIVSEDLWHAAQRQLASNMSSRTYREELYPALARGLVTCGTCGLPMHTDTGKRNAQGLRYHYYRCSARFVMRRSCGGRSIRMDKLDADLWDDVVSLIAEPRVLEREFERHTTGARVDPDVERQHKALQRQRGELDDRQRRLVRDYARSDGALFELLRDEVAAIEEERRRLDGLLAETTKALEAQAAHRSTLVTLEGIVEGVRPRMRQLPFADRRKLVELLGFRAWGNGQQWTITPFHWDSES